MNVQNGGRQTKEKTTVYELKLLEKRSEKKLRTRTRGFREERTRMKGKQIGENFS